MGNLIYYIQFFILGLMQLGLYQLLFHTLDLKKYRWKIHLTLSIVTLGILTVIYFNRLYVTSSSSMSTDIESDIAGCIFMTLESIVFFLLIFLQLKIRKILSKSWLKMIFGVVLFSILSSLLFFFGRFIPFFLLLFVIPRGFPFVALVRLAPQD